MQTVTLSDQCQVVLPIEIRRCLSIAPGCQLDFILEGNTLRVEVKHRIQSCPSKEGYGLQISKRPLKTAVQF